MKKRFWIVFFTLITIICLSFAISACSKDNNEDNSANNSQNEQSGNDSQGEVQENTPPANKNVYDMSGVVFNNLTVTYDGQPHGIEATNLPDGVAVVYAGNDKVNVGTYTVTAHFIGDSVNYEPIADMLATLTIEKATYDMSGVSFSDATVSYNGLEQFIAVEGNMPRGVTVTYEGNGQVAVGKYSIIAHFTGDSMNYELIPDMRAQFTIEKRGLNITFLGEAIVKYDGEVHKEITAKATNLVGNDAVEIIISYSGEMIEAGEYSVTASIADHANYTLTTNNTLTVTITRELHKVTFKQYGQPDRVLEVLDLAGLSENIIPPPIPEIGYDVIWEDVELSCITEDMTVNAIRTVINYSITYHLNNGINDENNPVTYNIESNDITLHNPTSERDDIIFSCWYLDENYEMPITAIVQGSSGNIELYAKWVRGTAGLTFSIQNGNCLVTGYNGTATELVLPVEWGGLSVTNINTRAFYNFSNLISIEIPASVTSIGDYAFYGCNKLEAVYLSDIGSWCNIDFKSFESNPLYYAHNLYLNGNLAKEIVIPDDVTYINRDALFYCTSIESVIMGVNVTSIGQCAFYHCENLKSVQLSEKLTAIGSQAFEYCTELECIQFPNSVQTIGQYAFEDCTSIESVTFGRGIDSIGSYAFRNCTNIKEVKADDIISWCRISFGTDANPLKYAHNLYIGEKLVSDVVVPNGILEISAYAFTGSTSLKSISFGDNLTAIGECAFYDCTNLESIIVPNSVTDIGRYTFWNCTSLTNVSLSENLTSIQENSFFSCTNLIRISIPDNVKTIEMGAFQACTNLNEVIIGCSVEILGDYAFAGCENLLSIVLPTTVTSIGFRAFYYCINLLAIEIPEWVEQIGEYAFQGCESLTQVNWNSTNCSIAGSETYPIFSECNNLKKVYIGGAVQSIPAYTFFRCTSITEVHTISVESWCAISFENGYANPLEYSHTLYINGEQVTKLHMPNSVTKIEEYTFYGFNTLEAVYVDSLEVWCNISFGGPFATPLYYAHQLYINDVLASELVIPNSITSLSRYAFAFCTSIEEIAIPDSVTTIGGFAFYDCTNLKKIVLGNNVTSIDSYTFSGCTSLTSIDIADSVLTIEMYAFEDCTQLNNIIIGLGLTTIREHVFDNCTNLTTVYYKGTSSQWSRVSTSRYGNTKLTSATRYYYSETEPNVNMDGNDYDGNYWHYVNEVPTIWKKQN